MHHPGPAVDVLHKDLDLVSRACCKNPQLCCGVLELLLQRSDTWVALHISTLCWKSLHKERKLETCFPWTGPSFSISKKGRQETTGLCLKMMGHDGSTTTPCETPSPPRPQYYQQGGHDCPVPTSKLIKTPSNFTRLGLEILLGVTGP